MTLPCYLAMTGAEYAAAETVPERIGWMACHFSCYGTGLSNLPRQLPKGSMLILNDRTPVSGHDPKLILQQLQQCIKDFACCGLLLDFQRPDCPQLQQLCQMLEKEIPCPMAVSELYAKELSCPVFVASPPLRRPLDNCLLPWAGREIWLEAALEAERAVIDKDGCKLSPCQPEPLEEPWFSEPSLFCRYHWVADEDQLIVTVQRQREDLQTLLHAAESLGVTRAVGLYQQLGP